MKMKMKTACVIAKVIHYLRVLKRFLYLLLFRFLIVLQLTKTIAPPSQESAQDIL